MLTDLLDTAGLVIGFGVAVAILYGAYRLFGTKGLLSAIAALFVLFLYRKGREDGSETHIEKERSNADHAVREADAARARAGVRDADPERLRDTDGFRRD